MDAPTHWKLCARREDAAFALTLTIRPYELSLKAELAGR
jgi:hypothetical protein